MPATFLLYLGSGYHRLTPQDGIRRKPATGTQCPALLEVTKVMYSSVQTV